MIVWTDIENEYEVILTSTPRSGVSEPREWVTFMCFGKGVKVKNHSAEPSAWTVINALVKSHKSVGHKKEYRSS